MKLQKLYERAHRMQDDAMHKYTTHLVKEYDAICIEDLDVKGMLMSHVASKGVHRALFGRFRSYLEYKCKSAGVKLVIANRFYPSTQRCAACGNIKKDDELAIKSMAPSTMNMCATTKNARTMARL
ncbi:RNA-guided endonuclease TnpB family protein [Lactobacillus delbrueckii subsp. bulgaricus]|nr:RNA-guided endonuclease TnpB family protein [Lactobacillus delbrueckii subsp. bulgaricus]